MSQRRRSAPRRVGCGNLTRLSKLCSCMDVETALRACCACCGVSAPPFAVPHGDRRDISSDLFLPDERGARTQVRFGVSSRAVAQFQRPADLRPRSLGRPQVCRLVLPHLDQPLHACNTWRCGLFVLQSGLGMLCGTVCSDKYRPAELCACYLIMTPLLHVPHICK